jgi:protease IV
MSPPNRSIFSSSFHAFCKSFAVVFGFLAAIAVVMIVVSLVNDDITTPDKEKLTVGADAEGQREVLPKTAPVLLRINITGIVGEGNLAASKVENLLLASREGVLEGSRVKGILLYINTPGGTANDADTIYRALLAYKEKYQVPIYSYVEGLCASGGMYIAAASDKILASPESVIGSVGVLLGPTFNVVGAMEKIGVKSLTLTEGKDKDMLNPFRNWEPGEEESIKKIMAALYERFVDIVVAARPALDKNSLIQDYGAQIFIAEEAEQIGFIDNGNSDYNSALKELAAVANIKENEKYQVLHIEPSRGILSGLAQGTAPLLKGSIKHVFPLGPNITSEMSGKFLYLYTTN